MIRCRSCKPIYSWALLWIAVTFLVGTSHAFSGIKSRAFFQSAAKKFDDKPKLILISGSPGTGKSTFGMSGTSFITFFNSSDVYSNIVVYRLLQWHSIRAFSSASLQTRFVPSCVPLSQRKYRLHFTVQVMPRLAIRVMIPSGAGEKLVKYWSTALKDCVTMLWEEVLVWW